MGSHKYRSIEIYLTASRATDKEGKVQTSIIFNCSGRHIIDIYDQFQWAEADKAKKSDKNLEKIECKSFLQ